MDFHYRNKNSVPVTVELGGKKIVVLPNSTVLVPEKYDYLIAKRGVLLERDDSFSFGMDQEKNPEAWIIPTTEEMVANALKEFHPPIDSSPSPESIPSKTKKSSRKKKKVTE